MRRPSLMFRGAAAAACTGLIATMWACSGDDSTAVGDDGGGSTSSSSSGGSSSSSGGRSSSSSSSGGSTSSGGSSSSSSSSSSGGSSSSGSGSSSSGSSSGSADAGHDGGSSSSSGGSSSGSSGSDGGSDGSREAASDAAHDSTVADADAEVDGGGGDATLADAGDAAADGGGTQLEWCPSLDVTFGLVSADAGVDAGICATVTNGSCPDRAGVGWASAVAFSGTIPSDFLNLLYADCRIEAMASGPVLTMTDVSDYENQVAVFTEAFFGCPDPTADIGPFNGFGLIPKPLSGHAFTTADVQLLEDMYVAAINQAFTDNNAPVLTTIQTTEVRASLVSRAAGVSPTTSSAYSYDEPSACPPDAGSDASTDGESDGGTEGSTDAGGG